MDINKDGRYHIVLMEHDISSMEIKLDFTIDELNSEACGDNSWKEFMPQESNSPLEESVNQVLDKLQEQGKINLFNFQNPQLLDETSAVRPTGRFLKKVQEIAQTQNITLEEATKKVWAKFQEYGEHNLKVPQPFDELTPDQREEANTMIGIWEQGYGVSTSDPVVSAYVNLYIEKMMSMSTSVRQAEKRTHRHKEVIEVVKMTDKEVLELLRNKANVLDIPEENS